MPWRKKVPFKIFAVCLFIFNAMLGFMLTPYYQHKHTRAMALQFVTKHNCKEVQKIPTVFGYNYQSGKVEETAGRKKYQCDQLKDTITIFDK
jgi:hypothetical protein